MRSLALYIFLFSCLTLLGLPMQGQDSFRFRIIQPNSSPSIDWTVLKVEEEIIYKPLRQQNTTYSFTNGSPKHLPAYKANSAILKLTITSPLGRKLLGSNRPEIIIKVTGSGSISPQAITAKIKLGAIREQKIEIPLNNPGEGSISLKVTQVSSDTSLKINPGDSQNQWSRNYEVLFFEEEEKLFGRLEKERDKVKVSEFQRLIDGFFIFTQDDLLGVPNQPKIRAEILRLNKELDQLHTEYRNQVLQNPLSASAAIKYYQIFGIQSRYASKAETALADFDENRWNAVDQKSIASLEEYLSEWKADIRDYSLSYIPLYRQEANNLIMQLIEGMMKGAQGNDCDQLQALQDKLEKFEYYQTHNNESRFRQLKDKITQCAGTDCESLYDQAMRYQTLSRIDAYLDNCPNIPSARRRELERIKARIIACATPRANFRRIQNDKDNLTYYVSLIKELLVDPACLSANERAQLAEWGKRVANIDVALTSGPTPNTSRRGYSNTLTFYAGSDIQIIKIDNLSRQADSSAFDELMNQVLTIEWTLKDSIMVLTFLDNEDHKVLFQALSGDTLSIPFKRGPFKVTYDYQEENGQLIIDIRNGDPPYRLEFQDGSSIRFYPFTQSRDTILIADLKKENFNGTYQLTVKDLYSRAYHFTDLEPLTITQEGRIELWKWLGIPVLIMIIFLIIRNTGGSVGFNNAPKRVKKGA